MTTKTRHAIAILGAACTLIAAQAPSALAQRPASEEINETFVLLADGHLILGDADIQPGAGGRTWTGKLESVWGDAAPPHQPDGEIAAKEPSTVTTHSPMVFDRQQPLAW
jgi:hypothetical protein